MKLAIKCLVLVLLVMFISGCGDGGCGGSLTGYTIDNGVILLDKEGTIACDLCEERGLQGKVIVLESAYCGACKAAIPVLNEVAKELGVKVEILDLSVKSDSLKMGDYRILPYYTPTMVVDGKVYIGGKSKEEYQNILSGFAG